MTTVVEHDHAVAVERTSRVSWGAVLAGLVFVIAMSWLFFLFGSALGVGIADASDMEAIGEGLGTGAIIWMLLSSLATFFLGSLLAARLAGRADKTTGVLHGVTLWSVGTTLILVLGLFGMTGLLQTGQAILKGAVSTGAAVGGAAMSGAAAAGSAGAAIADSPLLGSVQAQLKRQASELLSQVDSSDGAQVSKEDASQAIEEFDSQILQAVAATLIAGNIEGAKQVITNNTSLSQEQVNSLIDGVSNDIKDLVARSESETSQADNTTLMATVQDRISSAASELIASADAPNGPQVDTQDIEMALDQLDPDTLQTVAFSLIQGDTDSARNALVVNTNLSEQQINDLVDGVAGQARQEIEAFKQELAATTEAASDYAQAVLWIVFVSGLLGLVVSIAGGLFGATSVGRVYRITTA